MTAGPLTGALGAVPTDAAAPPEAAWGPMLVVALVVVAVVAMIVGFGRITRRRRTDDEPTGAGATVATGDPGDTATDDPLPTDPQQDERGRPARPDDPDGAGPASG